MPKFIVFAGPNGCGKSTLFHTNKDVFDIPRINVDEIVRENVGDGDPFTVHVTTKPGVKNTVTSLDNMGYAVTVFEY